MKPISACCLHRKTGEVLRLRNQQLQKTTALFSGVRNKYEKFSRDLSADPSKWWDKRSGKENSNIPNLEHKRTGAKLWVDNKSNAIQSEVTAMKSYGVEKQWQNLFSKPSQWWDHRSRKGHPRFPDFIHKQSGERLWLIGRQKTPDWVASKMACLGPGTSQGYVICAVDWLSRYNKAGKFTQTLKLYEQMQQENITPDFYIFLNVLQACAAIGFLKEGREIHGQIIETGWELHPYISSSLVNMYAKCGSIEDARAVFDKMPARDVVGWTAMMTGYVKCGQGLKALELFQDMQRDGVVPDSTTFVALLNACATTANLENGRRVHSQIIGSGFESSAYVANSLVDMYAKCGSMEDARALFDNMPTRGVVAWNAMILGYAKCGLGPAALELFEDLKRVKVVPNAATFVAVLKACARMRVLEEGRRAHMMIVRSGFESYPVVANSLVDMYGKCGSIEDAKEVFDKMTNHDVVSWNALILGYVKCGRAREALQLFEDLQRGGVAPDSTTFVALLNACARIASLEEGRRIHNQVSWRGFDSDPYVANSLVDMYAKCGRIEDAQAVFHKMPTRNLVAWNSMMIGCVKCGQGLEVLQLFQDMQKDGVVPDSTTFVALLNTCAMMPSLEEGRRVHNQVVRSGLELDPYVANSLVDMYSKCGSINEAQAVFDSMPTRDEIAWNAMILGFVKSGNGRKALHLFQEMELDGVLPNSITFVALLNACASMAALEEGRRIHNTVVRSSCEWDANISSSLVDMYAKCGSMENAKIVFDKMPTRDVVVWNAMILGFVNCGQGLEALQLFQDMQGDGVLPDDFTFVGLLTACGSLAALEEGRRVHDQVVLSGFEKDLYVANSLIDMYTKCGSMEHARAVFNKMPTRDVVSWTAMMIGYVKCGQGLETLELFQDMQRDGVIPDSTTFVAVLNACAKAAALDEGRRVHKQIVQRGCEVDMNVANSLVDMYAKCGSIEDAQAVFGNMPTRGVVSWNAMIMGLAMHGLGNEAVALFEQMAQSDCEMNEVTFIGLLSACSHGGLVKEGLQYFRGMHSVYGVTPTQEHFSCMVDLLARAGRLDEAEAVITGMPFEPSTVVWTSLLGACGIRANFEMGGRAACQVLKQGS